MNWVKLLSAKTKNSYTKTDKKNPNNAPCMQSSPEISFYERDVERVLFSNAFKRLQNKTQVVPLSDNDYIHNRYTHSLEVAAIGFDIGKRVGILIWDQKLTPDEKEQIQKFFNPNDKQVKDEISKETTRIKFSYALANIVKTGCLIHDIGNPPFGHQGEAAITEVLENYRNKNDKFKALTGKKLDLVKVEGNAQTLRLILLNTNIDLTTASIVSSFKYLRASTKPDTIYKKFGYYESEEQEFNDLIKHTTGEQKCTTNINSLARHPLTYLVEASDDIAYTLFDFEDFVRAGFIDFATLEDLFNQLTSTKQDKEILNNAKELGAKLSQLRSKAINALRNHVISTFIDKYTLIMTGNYTQDQDNALLSSKGTICGLLHIDGKNDMTKNGSPSSPNIPNIPKIISAIEEKSRKYGYNHKKVLKHGLAGYNIMKYLTETFLDAYYNSELTHSKMLRGMFPKVFTDEYNEYKNIRNIIDELTGMTDRYALQIYQILNGFNLQHIEI